MNLIEMQARGAAGLRFSPRTESTERLDGMRKALGFSLLPDSAPQIVVEDVLKHRPLRCFPPDCGWFAHTENGGGEANITLTLRDRAARYVLAEKTFALGSAPTLLTLPWPALAATGMPNADLEISVPLGSAPVFLYVCTVLERKNLTALCHGKGIEIGPGVGPQILPSPTTDVIYAEEKGREDWLKTYAYKMDKYDVDLEKLPWERYNTRPAIDLPAEDGSLDFIFSSHVFEHLVNPFAHLQHWLSKLKSGGFIAAMLPHCDYAADYNMNPSTLASMALEYQRKEMQPNLGHYRAMYGKEAEANMAAGRTLHVHFYNEKNMQELLAYAASFLPISNTRIVWERNYKEFFFIVGKR